MVALLLCLYLVVYFNRSRLCWARIRTLHRDEVGGVQSLSFVLTLPFLIMLMLFIVQVSQLMIGAIMVHYSAYAAARTAIVWIPAQMMEPEGCNRIGTAAHVVDTSAPDSRTPITDAVSSASACCSCCNELVRATRRSRGCPLIAIN